VPASVISDRTCISSRGDKVVQLSAEDVLRCCKNCTKNTNVCDGGSTSEAWEFWMNEGVVSGGDYNSKEVRLFVAVWACREQKVICDF
jgi:cathepsin B